MLGRFNIRIKVQHKVNQLFIKIKLRPQSFFCGGCMFHRRLIYCNFMSVVIITVNLHVVNGQA